MKKIITIMLFIFAALLSLCSCSDAGGNFETVYNYMQRPNALSCGKYFVRVKDKIPFVFTNNTDGYYVANNAVEIQQIKMSGILYADEKSFYYYEWQGDNSYGNSIGYSIYRYYPETRKRKLIFSDVSITNFDSALGLEDVFSISAPTSGHGVNMQSGFYFSGDTVIPEYKLKSQITDEIIKQGSDIELSPFSLSFVVTDNKVFFKDVSDKLWRYDPETHKFDKFYNGQTSLFFATSKNFFVISNPSGNIKVLDLTGNELKELKTEKAEFSMGSLQEFGGNCYLRDENGDIWLIDSALNIINTEMATRGDWCVKDGEIVLFEDKKYDVTPTISDEHSVFEDRNEPSFDQTHPEEIDETEPETTEHTRHDFKMISVAEATCISKGREQYVCDCGETYEKETDILPHTPSHRQYCTDEIVCLNCMMVIEPAIEHDMSSEGIYNNDAGCIKNGTVTIKCALCEYTETKEAENTALGHVDSDNNGLCDKCNIKIKNDSSAEQIVSIISCFWKLFFELLSKLPFENFIK